MMGIGFTELLIIFFIVLILFGAKKIPELGSGLGEGIRNFTKSFKGQDKTEDDKEDKAEQEKLDQHKTETKV